AGPRVPASTVNEAVAWMKATGASVKMGHAGVGSYGHLAGVLIAQELGVTVTQVPYRGAGPALVDLLAGQVDVESLSAVAAGPQGNNGKLKAYAIIGRKRIAGLPDPPTMGGLGSKKLPLAFWPILPPPPQPPPP